MRCVRSGREPIRARDSCDRDILGPDIALQILASHESEPDLQIGKAEPESVRYLVQLIRVGKVVLLDPAVVAAAGDSEGLIDLLVGDATVKQVVEQRPKLPSVLVGTGHAQMI